MARFRNPASEFYLNGERFRCKSWEVESWSSGFCCNIELDLRQEERAFDFVYGAGEIRLRIGTEFFGTAWVDWEGTTAPRWAEVILKCAGGGDFFEERKDCKCLA